MIIEEGFIMVNCVNCPFLLLKGDREMKKIPITILIIFLCFSMFLAFTEQIRATDSLIGYWKFDEESGNAVLDSSGNGYDGTVYGATWVSGKVGYALNFDGTDDYVSISSFNLPSLTSLTVGAWMDSSLNQIGYIFYNGESGEFLLHNGQRAFDGASGQYPNLASFSVKFGSVSWVDVFSNPITPNSWHYIVGVWTKGVSIRIYVDGILEGENNAIPDEYLFNPGLGYTATVGRYYIPEPDYFQGSIDEIKVYNYARTAEEIQSDYASVGPPVHPVGGEWIPINKYQLLAPWIGLVFLMTAAIASIVYVKARRKKLH